MLELGPLGGFNACQVQHAYASAIGAKQWRTSAAVDGIDIIKMLAAVQPYGLQLRQRGADGGCGQRTFRQVCANACDEIDPAITAVNRAMRINDHALRVGQYGKVARAGNCTGQAL